MDRMPAWFVGSSLLLIVVSAIRPLAYDAWLLENVLVLFGAVCLWWLTRSISFSNAVYGCILAFLALHEYGAHYYYTATPLGEWMRSTFGLQRNHYDRIAHFSFGLLLAYPFQEFFEKTCSPTNRWRWFIPLLAMMTAGAFYELIEAGAAFVSGNSKLADNFMGMQGDPWDSQIDMALAGLGALIATAFVASRRR